MNAGSLHNLEKTRKQILTSSLHEEHSTADTLTLRLLTSRTIETLISGLLTSITVKEQMCIILSHLWSFVTETI